MTLPHRLELISPAGDRTSLLAALQAGADAVYFGAEGYNMRAASRNFTRGDFTDIAGLCGKYHAKAYLALNTVVYDDEIQTVEETVMAAKDAGLDAVICWDLSVIEACRKADIPFHISTQASVSNYSAVQFYASLGARMIVPARELTLEQVQNIISSIRNDRLNVTIECFIHGAMCMAVSGRCFLSQDIFGRSANRGACMQPCRRSYTIIDAEDGHELELGTDTVMSPKDLCTITFIDKLIKAGVTGFKIEGRNRSPEYVHTTTTCYRKAIDYTLEHAHEKDFSQTFDALTKELMKELETVYNRGFSKGFYFGKPVDAWTKQYGSLATEKKVYVGTVQKYYPKAGVAEILVHTKGIDKKNKLTIQGPKTGLVTLIAESLRVNDQPADSALKGEIVTIACAAKVRKNDKVYVFESFLAHRDSDSGIG
ncbi:peptidase U32 family protein [Prosthecochloris sp. SCSIO W1103]|uniref:peptidase U32 family protein n=1 Tax=Prosthecochloris sp. SCSIO W1103 TaxID=2992244 RepID=UPI00223C9963|nr:peptidase U32 family protein [Prosthecochloris sp. SCSIO W1103]UZJ37250.1 U32 family peptidase [Prosthecochloris sp. SCSIO W1103]